MKNTLKTIIALVLVGVMMFTTAAVAEPTPAALTNGEIGGSNVFATDKPATQVKKIDIKKELTVYNVDETSINAPTITYKYTVTEGPADVKITDATTDHANNTAVSVNTWAGVTEKLKVNNVAGTTGSISWTPTETVTASTDGTPNYKNLTLDFTDVVFKKAGVFRYTISEALDTEMTYTNTGVTETGNKTNPHTRYLDVYVRPNPTTFTDGNSAADWDIYGYVCVLESEEITDAGDTASTGAVKTNGFVSGTNDETAYTADSYFTYNVTISKTVTNDNYAKTSHAFPFTVIFTNSAITHATDIIGTVKTGTVTEWTEPASAALSAGETKGIAKIKDSSSVKYTGIPNGTTIEVYETNDVSGVTYQVTTTAKITTDTPTPIIDQAVVSAATPTTADAQAAQKAASQSTKTTFTPTVDKDDDVIHTIAVNNNLQLISPTGVTLRFAPYILILAAGIVLLLVSRRRKSNIEK